MHYQMEYDRRQAKYTVTWPGGREEFSMWTAFRVWTFLQHTLEPGDTLTWLPNEPEPDIWDEIDREQE